MKRKPTPKTAKKKTSTAKAKKTSKAKPSVRKVLAAGEVRPGSKLEIIVGLLRRKEGCTTADVLKATGWPSVSMPQQANAAGIKLATEKDGRITRYREAQLSQ